MKNKTFLYVTILLVCFIGAVLAGAYFATFSSSKDKRHARTEEPPREELLTANDKTTIMIMGVDPRELEHDVGRSDTLMIATIDPMLDKATLLSIPRDTRVHIERHGYDKINAAYAYGGEKLTKRTVEDFLGVNLDHYVLIDTRSFVKIIDAIGGVDIDVEKRMRYEDPYDDDGGLHIDLYPGMQHMDGKTAITYVRYRDEEGDIGRIERQQKFMKACMDKFISPSIITRLPALVSEVMDAIKTDMSITELLALAGTLRNAQKNGLVTEMVPGYPMYIDEISYWIPNVSAMRMTLAETLGVVPTRAIRSRWEETEREYASSIPKNAKKATADKNVGKEIKPKKRTDKDDDKKEKDGKKNRESEEKFDSEGNEITKKQEEQKETGDKKKESETPAKQTETPKNTEVNTERKETPANTAREEAAPPTPGSSGKTQ